MEVGESIRKYFIWWVGCIGGGLGIGKVKYVLFYIFM